MYLCFKTKREKTYPKDINNPHDFRKSNNTINKRHMLTDVNSIIEYKNVTEVWQRKLVHVVDTTKPSFIIRIENVEVYDYKQKTTTKQTMILSNQSINIVSLGGWFYNSIISKYNTSECKAVIENTDVYSLILFFEWTNKSNEIRNDVLILAHKDNLYLKDTRNNILKYLKDCNIKMPIYYSTERNIDDWHKYTVEMLKIELENLIKDKINKFLASYNIATQLDTLIISFVYLFKNEYCNPQFGYIVFHNDLFYFMELHSESPLFYFSLKKLKEAKIWLDENIISFENHRREKLMFIYDGINEFISKVSSSLRNRNKLVVRNLILNPEHSRVNYYYNNDDSYRLRLDPRNRKDYMNKKIQSIARGVRFYFNNYNFFKNFSKFYKETILLKMVDKLIMISPKIFTNSIQSTYDKTHHNNNIVMKYNENNFTLDMRMYTKLMHSIELKKEMEDLEKRVSLKKRQEEKLRLEEEQRRLKLEEERLKLEEERIRVLEEKKKENRRFEEEEKKRRLEMIAEKQKLNEMIQNEDEGEKTGDIMTKAQDLIVIDNQNEVHIDVNQNAENKVDTNQIGDDNLKSEEKIEQVVVREGEVDESKPEDVTEKVEDKTEEKVDEIKREEVTEKVEDKPEDVKPEQVDEIKPEEVTEKVEDKPEEQVDEIKPEEVTEKVEDKPEDVKPEQVDEIKPEDVTEKAEDKPEDVKPEQVDEIKPKDVTEKLEDKPEHVKPEQVDETKEDIETKQNADEKEHEKVETSDSNKKIEINHYPIESDKETDNCNDQKNEEVK